MEEQDIINVMGLVKYNQLQYLEWRVNVTNCTVSSCTLYAGSLEAGKQRHSQYHKSREVNPERRWASGD
jgi:hypothetical protein